MTTVPMLEESKQVQGGVACRVSVALVSSVLCLYFLVAGLVLPVVGRRWCPWP